VRGLGFAETQDNQRPIHSNIRVRAFTVFGDEAVDPRCNSEQRYRAKLEHRIVECADVEFETRSLPNLLVATLATLPSVSEIPFLDSRERLRLVDCNCASVDSEILP